MRALVAVAAWALAAALALVLPPSVTRRRWAMLLPLLASATAALTTSAGTSHGPLAGGPLLEPGREGAGLLWAAGLSASLALGLAPRLAGGEALTVALVGASCAVAVAATTPLSWGLALAGAAAVVTARWLAAHPGPPTLAAARVLGLGGALLVCVAPLLMASPSLEPRSRLAAALLVAGIVALLALLPAGGWARGAAELVPGAELSPWALLLVPAVLLTSRLLLTELDSATRSLAGHGLLAIGLLSALWASARAPAARAGRYGWFLAADVALAAAALGSGRPEAGTGILLVVLTHLVAGPLLLSPPTGGLRGPRAVAWLSVSGLPLTPAFWGRFLLLEGYGDQGWLALLAGLVSAVLLSATCVAALARGERSPDPRQADPLARIIGWGLAAAVVVVGLRPQWAASVVFGGS